MNNKKKCFLSVPGKYLYLVKKMKCTAFFSFLGDTADGLLGPSVRWSLRSCQPVWHCAGCAGGQPNQRHSPELHAWAGNIRLVCFSRRWSEISICVFYIAPNTHLNESIHSTGDLKLVEKPSPLTLAPHDFANIKANVKVASTENGIIFGNIGKSNPRMYIYPWD